ncbi:ABC transporter permease [Gracilibacillus sp. Marseille-QA3620]
MIKDLSKNKWFMTGLIFIFLLFSVSFAYPIFIEPYLNQPPKMLYEDGKLVDVPPYSPSFSHFFGVDRFGDDVFWMVIDGAKYTILIAVGVGVLRIFFGMIGGIIYGLYYRWLAWVVEPLTRAFRFVPAVLIAILFLQPFLGETGPMALVKQCLILTFIAFLPITSVIGAEVNHYLKYEFIKASETLGGSKYWMLKKHILLYLRPRMYVLIIQQINQALLLLIHLGVLNFVIGGVKFIDLAQVGEQSREVASSLSNEWTGMIGLSYRELQIDPWIVVGPCIGFVLTILSFNMIIYGLQKVFEERPVYEKKNNEATQNIIRNNEDFELIKDKRAR